MKDSTVSFDSTYAIIVLMGQEIKSDRKPVHNKAWIKIRLFTGSMVDAMRRS